MQLASRINRLLGQFIDGIITALPLFAAVLGVSVSDTLGTVLFVIALIVSIAYYFLADALPGGQSYGKRALGIRVIDEKTQQPCSAAQSLIRNLLLAILGPIDWVFIFGAKHQRLGDKAAGTIVVTDADSAELDTL
jgi:uncharacterized RDD family membrane protein YckC